MRHAPVFRQSFDRPNLRFSVVYKDVESSPQGLLVSTIKRALGLEDEPTPSIQGRTKRAGSGKWVPPRPLQGMSGEGAGEQVGFRKASDFAAAAGGFQSAMSVLGSQTTGSGVGLEGLDKAASRKRKRLAKAREAAIGSAGQSLKQLFSQPSQTQPTAPPGPGPSGSMETSPGQAPQGCGIVYVHKRDDCAGIAALLCRAGVPARPYHAGLSAGDRTEAQQAWMGGEVWVIVATVAFGMGIDKADVRVVAHWTCPKSIEGYYQVSGRHRAGDGVEKRGRHRTAAAEISTGVLMRQATGDGDGILLCCSPAGCGCCRRLDGLVGTAKIARPSSFIVETTCSCFAT